MQRPSCSAHRSVLCIASSRSIRIRHTMCKFVFSYIDNTNTYNHLVSTEIRIHHRPGQGRLSQIPHRSIRPSMSIVSVPKHNQLHSQRYNLKPQWHHSSEKAIIQAQLLLMYLFARPETSNLLHTGSCPSVLQQRPMHETMWQSSNYAPVRCKGNTNQQYPRRLPFLAAKSHMATSRNTTIHPISQCKLQSKANKQNLHYAFISPLVITLYKLKRINFQPSQSSSNFL